MRPGTRLQRLMREANKATEMLGDDYISVEHLLLALLLDKGEAGKILAEAGFDAGEVEKTVRELRGGQKVASENPEATMDALEKYGRDLTAEAEEGKLDPVIGRDDEIIPPRILTQKSCEFFNSKFIICLMSFCFFNHGW